MISVLLILLVTKRSAVEYTKFSTKSLENDKHLIKDLKLETPQQIFEASDQIFNFLRLRSKWDNLDRLKSELPGMFCQPLTKSLNQETSLPRANSILRALKELKCDIPTSDLERILGNSTVNLNKFEDIYAATSIAISLNKTPAEIASRYCDLVPRFITPSLGKIKESLENEITSWKYSAKALKLLKICSKYNNDLSIIVKKLSTSLRDDLKKITKNTAGWLSETPISTTMQISTTLLFTDPSIISKENINRIIKFVEEGFSHKPTDQEKLEWDEFLEALEHAKIKLIRLPNTLSNNGTFNIHNLPTSTKAEIKRANGSITTIDLNSEGEIRLPEDILDEEGDVIINFSNSDYTIYSSGTKIKIQKDNRVSFIRMKTSAYNTVNDLSDSDDSDCANILLTANESTFVHIGFKTKFSDSFAFVQLKPQNSEYEKSAVVHAAYNEADKMYVAVFDLSDFETIRPNSDTYDILIFVGSVEKQCGQIQITFSNNKLTSTENIINAYTYEVNAAPVQDLIQKRFYFIGIYFIVVTVIAAGVYWGLFIRLFGKIELTVKSTLWDYLFLGGIVTHLLTLAYLVWIRTLIQQVWIAVLQIFFLSFLFKKNYFE